MTPRKSRPGSFSLACRWSPTLALFAVYLCGMARTDHHCNRIILATGKTKEQAWGRAWGVASDVRTRTRNEQIKACDLINSDIPLPLTTTIHRT